MKLDIFLVKDNEGNIEFVSTTKEECDLWIFLCGDKRWPHDVETHRVYATAEESIYGDD